MEEEKERKRAHCFDNVVLNSRDRKKIPCLERRLSSILEGEWMTNEEIDLVMCVCDCVYVCVCVYIYIYIYINIIKYLNILEI